MDRKMEFAGAAERGMTLIEIMVVIAIIGLMMGAVGLAAFEALKKARLKQAKADIHYLKAGIASWAIDRPGETCPKTLQELFTERHIQRLPRDPWGQDFLYACPGQTAGEDYEITSKGPDKLPGTEDDIKSAGL